MPAQSPDIEDLKRRVCAAIDRRKIEFVELAKDVFKNPETGFKETKTAETVARFFDRLGVSHQDGLAVTGIKARIQGGAGSGPSVAILGELDSLIVNDHPNANAQTGAAHACGHNAQLGMMLGASIGLMDQSVLPYLSGSIVPFAVPAEEFVEVEDRLALRQQGRLEFLGGKQELIRVGEFDDVDLAMMCHTASDMKERSFSIGGASNGHMVKFVEYAGRSAHAGAAPHEGINALNAANLALAAIHLNRETFTEKATARTHGMITKGGEAVNAVPGDVRVEWRVRSSNPEDLERNSAMVDRCFRSGAMAVGARVTITNIAGYFSLNQDESLKDLFVANAASLLGKDRIALTPDGRTRGGSTDMGDLSQIMPVIHPYTAGATGGGHSRNYRIKDYEQAVVMPAKIMAMTAVDLLADGGVKARQAVEEFQPPMTRDQYVAFQRSRFTTDVFDGASP